MKQAVRASEITKGVGSVYVHFLLTSYQCGAQPEKSLSGATCETQKLRHAPVYMSARFAGSLASVMSSFTVYSTLSVLSNFLATVERARSAASSVAPLAMSIPIPNRKASPVNCAVSPS